MTPDEAFDLGYNFDRKSEGAFYEDPNAGPTNFGILQSTYSAWLKSKSLPDADVRHISQQEVRQINSDNYWTSTHFDQIATFAPATAIACYDFSENIGSRRVIEMLQRRLNVIADGFIGPGTLHALHSVVDPNKDLQFAVAFTTRDREAWYESHSPSSVQRGLANRCANLAAYLQEHFA